MPNILTVDRIYLGFFGVLVGQIKPLKGMTMDFTKNVMGNFHYIDIEQNITLLMTKIVQRISKSLIAALPVVQTLLHFLVIKFVLV